MKILHISFSDGNGGAAIAALRLHEAMINAHIESKMLVFDKTSNLSTISQLNNKWKKKFYQAYHNIFQKIKQLLLKPTYTFGLGVISSKIHHTPLIEWADIIYIHWCGFSFLNIKEIQALLKTKKPVILYMHDMWYITGGCHHSFGCNKYETECRDCHLIKQKRLKDIVHFVLKKKMKAWNYNTLAAITPSNWLGQCAKNSILLNHKNVYVIPNLIDTDIFKPLNKINAKELLNLNTETRYICFGAIGGSQNKHKGWDYLIKALTYIENSKGIEIILFGGYISDEEIRRIPLKVHQLGHLTDKYTLVAMYNACDVYVLPSLAENLPQTMMEAISCGAIGCGFDIGGMPDLIKHKLTGYLAKYKDAKDLGTGINWALNCCISRVEQHQFIKKAFGTQKVLEQHRDLWQTIKKTKQ